VQEEVQREAFEGLLLAKDAKFQRLQGQIALIQDELTNLTVVEIEKRTQRTDEEMVLMTGFYRTGFFITLSLWQVQEMHTLHR